MDKLSLVIMPFHDWRKVQQEGARTRDAHLIEHLSNHPEVESVLIINRPMTVVEMIYRKTHWKTSGESISKKFFSRMVRVSPKTYAVDFLCLNPLPQMRQGKAWFFRAFQDQRFVGEVREFCKELNMTPDTVISFNPFAAGLCDQLNPSRCLFDAFDNFLRIPQYRKLNTLLQSAYGTYAKVAKRWTTNSLSNKEFYEREFGVSHCELIRNGVDPEKFRAPRPLPQDMAGIRRPIIGLGAKVTHLIDSDLFNAVSAAHPEKSFVIIGQILDHKKFRSIRKRPNVHYLGDKHYDSYPSYVAHFDVCILPYVVGDREHGQDSIKLYEYLAARKPVVTTNVNGIDELKDRVHVGQDAAQFSALITAAVGVKPADTVPDEFCWKNKADRILRIVKGMPHAE